MKDIDSLSSSILYAYLRSLNPLRTAFSSSYIPLLNIPASDIQLRSEFTALFKHADISASHLITLDDLPSFDEVEKKLKPTNTCWVLVDHNKLQGPLGTIYQNRIQGVIDHHEEENAVPQDPGPEPRVVEKCGSCTSLVIRTLKTTWDSISMPSPSLGTAHAEDESRIDSSTIARTLDAQIAKIALASILIDTANLKEKDKVEPADEQAVEYLESKIHLSLNNDNSNSLKWDRTQFYNEINNAKSNINHLKFPDILRKDYKQWTENGLNLGISAIVKPLDFLITKVNTTEGPQLPGEEEKHDDAFSHTIKTFIANRNLSIFAIMTTSTSSNDDDTFQRQLFLQSSPVHSHIISKFLQRAIDELDLEPLTIDALLPSSNNNDNNDLPLRYVYRQKDISKSRKQVAPILREAMR